MNENENSKHCKALQKKKKKGKKKKKKLEYAVSEEMKKAFGYYTQTTSCIPITSDEFIDILSNHIFKMLNIKDKLSLLYVNKQFYQLIISPNSYHSLILDPFYFCLKESFVCYECTGGLSLFMHPNGITSSNIWLRSYIEYNSMSPSTNRKLHFKTLSNLQLFEIDCKIAYETDAEKNKNCSLMLLKLIQLSPKLKTLKLYRFDILKIHKYFFPIPLVSSLTNLTISFSIIVADKTNNYSNIEDTHNNLLRLLLCCKNIKMLHIMGGLLSDVSIKLMNDICNTIHNGIKTENELLNELKVFRISMIKNDNWLNGEICQQLIDLFNGIKSLNTLILDFNKTKIEKLNVKILKIFISELMKKSVGLNCVSFSLNGDTFPVFDLKNDIVHMIRFGGHKMLIDTQYLHCKLMELNGNCDVRDMDWIRKVKDIINVSMLMFEQYKMKLDYHSCFMNQDELKSMELEQESLQQSIYVYNTNVQWKNFAGCMFYSQK
eukprot:403207_1